LLSGGNFSGFTSICTECMIKIFCHAYPT
jgi:hypothetical protein